ncbi:hypothetical protein MSM1_05230 [Mycobacterium sp. SM1]|uniref:hypothetical protein n=1 Tax=Mycobacterium sp. SM1 TaxID=2816243 RepID=UPI001BCF6EDD|nr:hypothetical protein [Mycobacterium sp. SM1]MBS4727774.1 hypothetical protein [Mycobacterium sp. SM1]
MTETPEPITGRTPPVTTAPHQPNRLYQAAAWVAIVAGTVFVVAVVFFSGFVLGRHAGPHHFLPRHQHHNAVFHPRHAHRGPGPVTPGGPARGPGGQIPGPGQPPASIAPSAP